MNTVSLFIFSKYYTGKNLLPVCDVLNSFQTSQSLSTSCESLDVPHDAVVCPQRSIKTVTDCISELREKVESLMKDTWPRISATGNRG